MLGSGCTLHNLANICQRKTTDAKTLPFTESNKDLLEKIRLDMMDGPSNVFTHKAVVGKTLIRKSMKRCKSIVAFDASFCILAQSVILCQEDFARVGILIRRSADFYYNRTKP